MKYVSPDVRVMNCSSLDSMIFSSLITSQKIGDKHFRNPCGFLDSVYSEIRKKHYSVLEFGDLDFLIQDVSNWDMFYLSSYRYVSIMKSSFRRVEHDLVSVNPLVKRSLHFENVDFFLRKFYDDANIVDNCKSEDERKLPMCSTGNYLVRLNFRELLHILNDKKKLPVSLECVMDKIVNGLSLNVRDLVDFGLNDYKDNNYRKDRMFSIYSGQFEDECEGLVYDNLEDVSFSDSMFLFKKNISFKLLSQIMRERELGIELNFDNVNFIGVKDYVLEDLVRLNGVKDSLAILPFSAEVESYIRIPRAKIDNGFFGKLGANKSMRDFAEFVRRSVKGKYSNYSC